MTTFTLHEFMQYPNLAFKLAMMLPPIWPGAPLQQRRARHHHCMVDGVRRVWFWFGVINLIYQNVGMLIYLLPPSQMKENVDAAGNGTTGGSFFAKEPEEIALLAKIAETGGIMGLAVVAVCKMWILFRHENRILKLMVGLQTIFPSEHIQMQQQAGADEVGSTNHVRVKNSALGHFDVRKFAHKSNLLMKRTTIFFIAAFLFYNSLPLLELAYELASTRFEVTYRYQSNTWYPWQAPMHSKAPMLSFFGAYFCQFQASLSGVSFIMAGEFMLCFFITQMEMHFDFLANALLTLDARNSEANMQLKMLIIYHNRLLTLAEDINEIFNISFLVNFATSSIAICLMCFSMVMISLAHTFKYFVGLLSFLVFTLFICYNGNNFTEAGNQLLPAAFYHNWYDGDITHRKMTAFFLMHTSRPLILSAYKFATVSMRTYATWLP